MLKKLPNGMYVDEDQDIIRTLPDDRTELIAAKGVPLTEAQAQKAGLIKTHDVGPSETKIDPGASNVPTTGVPTGEVVTTGVPAAGALVPAADSVIGERAVSDGGLVDTSTHVIPSEEVLAAGSNATNPRARGANRRS